MRRLFGLAAVCLMLVGCTTTPRTPSSFLTTNGFKAKVVAIHCYRSSVVVVEGLVNHERVGIEMYQHEMERMPVVVGDTVWLQPRDTHQSDRSLIIKGVVR